MDRHLHATLPRSAALGLMLLSCTTLMFEVILTRLFSVAQFYHFAFMIVSLALLGFGISGTVLAIFPRLARTDARHALGILSATASAAILVAYSLTNLLPFDSFSIAWDVSQVIVLIIHYLALSMPFFFCGLVTGILLSQFPDEAGTTYAFNMLGSALGCFIALAAPLYLGGEGSIVLSSALAAFAACLILATNSIKNRHIISIRFLQRIFKKQSIEILLSAILLIFCCVDVGSRLQGKNPFPFLNLHLSPYKSLSYILQFPQAETISSRWNAFSRIDVIESSGIRSLPGISYRYMKSPPDENGITVDGDDLSPVVLSSADPGFANYMPAAIAYELHPHAHTLILDAYGGLDVLCAIYSGASQVTAVEQNSLIIQAAPHIYHHKQVTVVNETSRSYTNKKRDKFDVIVLSLANTYHPVNSGAYSLSEDYRNTIESYRAMLRLLKPDGILVINRWLQTPPSEFLRAFTLAVTALEQNAMQPGSHIAAFRGYNMGTLLIKASPFTSQELASIRQFTGSLSFDLVYVPDIHAEEVNRYNILPKPVYYNTFTSFLEAQDRSQWYDEYPFDVRPPTDDHPFFNHFFKWSQAGSIVANLGKTWQPFGGAGYFVILTFLLLAIFMSALLILLPLATKKNLLAGDISNISLHPKSIAMLAYFLLIGLGFILVELPLIQYFILFLGYPAYALTAVIFTLLFFSSLGSRCTTRIPRRIAIGTLVFVLICQPFLLPIIFSRLLHLPFTVRLALSILLLAPPGFLMGTMFPNGIRDLEKNCPHLITWAWGINGAASVVASGLAALLSLNYGFRLVLYSGAACYACVWLLVTYIKAADFRLHRNL